MKPATGRVSRRPFAGLLDAVVVEPPASFLFTGSIARDQADAVWTWVVRDLCSDLISVDGLERGSVGPDDIEVIVTEMIARMRAASTAANDSHEASRRLRAQLGNDEAHSRLPMMISALRCRALLAKAQAFGKASNTITDDAVLGAALQAMPLHDPQLAAMLFHAAMGQVTNPTRMVTAVLKLSAGPTETAIVRAGFGPLIDAILALAQNQLHLLQPNGAFADIDLTCKGLERFHRLARAVTGYVELSRNSHWTSVLSGLTKQVSDRIEQRLKAVVPDMNQSLRKTREGADRLDDDRLLAAISGMYLLATVRECRDSLALNAVFDQAWSQSGQVLEQHLTRNLDMLRQDPTNTIVGARMAAGIKMAEVRFNPEYADTLRRARAAAERRV